MRTNRDLTWAEAWLIFGVIVAIMVLAIALARQAGW